ncbi:uridine diphosphate glucose pyrophosphatase NUDT22-like [Asterias amurensis]|uniref:uridine diphosphate glucose pyrophosphatase NUDT22-like n=1 Tax=Asterias amurensis TaxID=7602 RepID=UPI003AB86FCE
MDPEISVIFAASRPPGVPQSKLRVKLLEEYNRKTLPSHESNINRIWGLRTEQNPKLYNGSKFRFHSLYTDNTSGEVTFGLGITGYKDFIGTNWADNAAELLESGRRDFSNSQAYMSDALGVGAFVQTADDCVIFIRRSQHVGEAQGLWDIPGGHPEPGEVKGGAARLEDIILTDMTDLDVRNELICSTIREIRDEINIPESELGEPYLIGLAKNNTSSGRPSAEFFVKCTLHSSKVMELYKAGGAEADESTGLKLVPLAEVMSLENTDMWKKMAPSAKGCVKMYTLMIDS